ncbi:MAG: PQQ-binding-like beta-propeller repeat protein [Flavipsychrobacter sp.]|nr:PQQ-binding-like beta-propeller repeat protein [Flavipsychrobacter sp.]
MLQRWMKSLAVVTTTCLLFAACKQKTYSPDEPLPDTYTPSVFIGSQNRYLYAIDPATGTTKWELNMHNNIVATPIVVGNFLYVPSADTFYKLDVKKGTVVRKYYFNDADFKGFYSSPVSDGKTVYIASLNDTVYALDVNADNIRWKHDMVDTVLSSLVIYNGGLIVANTKGVIKSLNIVNGIQQWAGSIPVPVGSLSSSPAVSSPYLYVGSTDGNMHALYLSNGTPAWTFPTGGIVASSPIVYGGNVIFGSADNYVYCVDSTAKTARWKFKTNDRVMSSAAAYGQVVYIGGYDSYLYALNILDGSLKWKYLTKSLIQSSVLATDGSVYMGGFDKMFYKLDTTGNLKWTYNMGGIIQTSPVFYDLSRAYYPSITGSYQY